jgi:hypothetical protein
MQSNWKLAVCAWLALALSGVALAAETAVPNRITHAIDETKLVRLQGNVHPMARAEFDKGALAGSTSLERMVLVLKRSPEQEAALTAFAGQQYDRTSPNFHHWLTPEEFGETYGPSNNDLLIVTSWLQNHGFQIYQVSKGRVTIEFSGTAEQVQQAFHTEIHRFFVKGEEHIANVSDPQIPEAIAPVVEGIASLHNFFPKPQMIKGAFVTRNAKTGKVTPVKQVAKGGSLPQYTYTDNNGYTREDISPYDFATIYNVLPLWNAGIKGAGQKIAISGASDISLADVATFQKSFGLPNNPPTIIHNGTDPGLTDGARGENTLDVEWSGAVAPQATVVMVVSASTQTTFGGQLSDAYIVDNLTASVMSASYGSCELNLGTTGNSAYNKIWQQGAVEGISIFESAGDQGSAGCESQDTPAPNASSTGLQVNGMASSPYVTAVGGTDFLWQTAPSISTYWNTTNSANGATAKGYIPEIPWNSTCASTYIVSLSTDTTPEQFCNDAYNGQYDAYQDLVVIAAGSGGKSACTTPTGTTPASCEGGYAKPAWQVGTGVPSDGKRDLPDVSLFASGGYPDGLVGSAYLICDSETESCNYTNPDEIIYQEVGGTSVSSPAMAGIMALILQKMGEPQGLANPVFYELAQLESLSSCNSNTVQNGSSCVFYDTTSGTNSQVCVTGSPNCVTTTSGDTLGVLSGYSAGTGYDLATGLGSINANNLANSWAAGVSRQALVLSPASLTFTSTGVGTASAAQTVTVSNTGSKAYPVTISSVGLSGTNASSYSETTTCGTTLAASSTCTISVTFKPTTTGTLTAKVVLKDNATGSPQSAALSGSVASGSPVASVSPGSLTFASTPEGSTTAAQVVTLNNTGGATLTINTGGISISGTNASSFADTTTCGSTLAAGANCTISVTFKPAATGTLTATLNIADNASGSPQKVTLTGTGTTAVATVSLSVTSVVFPNTVEGVASQAQTVLLTNTGTPSVGINSIVITGTNATSFSELSTCGAVITSGESCRIFVVFKPTTTGALTATLNVHDSATGSPQTASLSGTGTTAPTVTVTPTSLAFATTAVGTTSIAQGVTVKNSGTANLTVTSITLAGTNASSFVQANECGSPLAPGASCAILVALKPTVTGSLTATLSIADNGSGSPQVVTLTGTGH